MEKNKIKALLRENFLGSIQEETPSNNGHNKEFESNYEEVQRKLNGTLLKASQVMGKSGLGDPNSATDRSLFSKKVNRVKNEDGSTYQFDKEELAKVIKVLNNPSAYLNVKNA